MNINPILKRELRVQSRGHGLLVLICGVNAILFMIGILGCLAAAARTEQSLAADYGVLLDIYGLVAMALFVFMVMICPALTSGSISGERQSKTLELLMATGMSDMSIILGKLAASLYTVAVLLISCIPSIVLPLVYGGVSLLEVLQLVMALMTAALMTQSLGLFAGTLGFSVQRSTALAYIFLVVLLFGTFLPAFMGMPFSVYGRDNWLALLLILNPAVIVLSVVSMQVGGGSFPAELFARLNLDVSEVFLGHYIPAAMIAELFFSLMIIFASVKSLDMARGGFGYLLRKRKKEGIEK